MNPELYLDIQASLLRYCTDFIEATYPNKFETIDFDVHASVNELPNSDVIGVSELVITEDNHKYRGSANFMVMTTSDDDNLDRLRPAIARLFYSLQTGARIQVVDRETGMIIGNLVTTEGVTVSPVARSDARPLQGVFVSFGSSFLSPP